MKDIGPAKMLELLGARPETPYSWGSVSKGDVFLRVWAHDVSHDRSRVLVLDPADDDLRDALGRPNRNALERQEHIQLIRRKKGKAFCIVAVVLDRSARRWETARVETDYILEGGEVKGPDHEGRVWLTIVRSTPPPWVASRPRLVRVRASKTNASGRREDLRLLAGRARRGRPG